MKKFSLKVVLIILIIGITGCGSSNTPSVPKVKTSKEFQFDKVNLNVTQLVQPDISYHSNEELEQMLNKKLHSLLEENNLLSTQTDMNTLVINATYERRFVGDETPIPSDSLAYPHYQYSINVKDHTKSLTKIEKSNLIYQGGFTLNLQVMAGTLRDKKYEIQFINALANTIFKDIERLHN
jgi:hypothetical protein